MSYKGPLPFQPVDDLSSLPVVSVKQAAMVLEVSYKNVIVFVTVKTNDVHVKVLDLTAQHTAIQKYPCVAIEEIKVSNPLIFITKG